MRICYVANSDISHTKKWASYFVEKGHEVHVISHKDVAIPGVKVYYIDYNIKNFIFKVKKVHSLIRRIDPDVLHAHQANTCGLYAATMKGYPFMVSAWGSDILVAPERSFIMKSIVKYVLKRAAYITSDAEYMTERIIELGAKKERVYTFPMGVSEDIFNYRHDYDLKSPSLNIVSIRKLEKIYRIDVLIKGFYEALKVFGDMTLTIGASGSQGEELIELVKKLGIYDKVIFTGRYEPEEAGKLLMDKDVFISIPESDSTSVSLLEGMAVGIFPIVSDLPGNREWVNDFENGIVLNYTSPKCIKEAILWCAKNKKHLMYFRDENINIIKKRALWRNNAVDIEKLYRNISKIKLGEIK